MDYQNNSTFQLLVDSQLINDWQQITPFTAGGSLTAFTGSDGRAQIMTVGNDGQLYNIWPDPDSQTGWGLTNMQWQGDSNSLFTVGTDLDGNNVVVVGVPIPMNSQNECAGLYYCKNDRWGMGWQSFSGSFVDIWGNGYTSLDQLQLYTGAEGLFCIINGYVPNYVPAGNYMGYGCAHDVNTYGIVPSGYTLSGSTVYDDGLVVYPFGGYTYNSTISDFSVGNLPNIGEGTLVNGTDMNGKPLIQFYPFFSDFPGIFPGTPVPVYSGDTFSAIATTINSSGYTEIFVIHQADSMVYYLQGNNGVYSLMNVSLNVPQGTTFSALSASISESGDLEVFALGSDHLLYHSHLDAATNAWTSMLPLISDINTFSTAKDGQGVTNLFAIDSSTTLYRLWNNEDSGWQVEEIELPSLSSTPIVVPSYTTQLTFLDAVTNNPIDEQPVTIWASDELNLSIDGKNYFIDAENPVSCSTDSSGKITVVSAADGINTPLLKINGGFLDSDSGLVINPFANAKAQLGSMTAAELAAAQTPGTGGQPAVPLLSSTWQSNPGEVQATIQQLLMFQPADSEDGPKIPDFINRGKRLTGINYTSTGWGDVKKINYDLIKGQHWMLTVSPEIKFEKLDAAAAQLYITQTTDSANSIFSSWSDFWGAVTSKALEITTFIVSEAQLVIQYVVDGVKYVFNQIMETVSQAIDALEGMLAFFGSTIGNWLEYLGNLLDWNDIWNTKTYIEQLFNSSIAPVQQFIAQGGSGSANFFKDLKGTVTDFFTNIDNYFPDTDTSSEVQGFGFQQAQSALLSMKTLGNNVVGDGSLTYNEVFSPTVANSWFMSKVAGSAGNGSFAALLQQVPGNLLQQINQFFTQLESSQVYADIQAMYVTISDYFQQVNQENFEQLTIATLINTFQELLLSLLDLMDVLFQTLIGIVGETLDMLQQAMNAPADIPVLSWIYENVICPEGQQQPPTMLNIFSLLIAVPMTLMYKMANNNNPPITLDSAEGSDNPAVLPWLKSVNALVFTEFDNALELGAVAKWMLKSPIYPAPVTEFFTSGAVVCQMVGFFATMPPSFTPSAPLDKAKLAAWCLRSAPLAINSITVMSTGRGPRVSEVGVAALVTAGLGILGTGIWKCVEYADQTPPPSTSAQAVEGFMAILPCLPQLGKGLLPFMTPTPEGVALEAALFLLDELGDLGMVVLPLVEYYEGIK